MYAAVLTKYGSPDVLAWSEIAVPEPGPGQIRIRVLAAGVGPTDLKIRRGDIQRAWRRQTPPSASCDSCTSLQGSSPPNRARA